MNETEKELMDLYGWLLDEHKQTIEDWGYADLPLIDQINLCLDIE